MTDLRRNTCRLAVATAVVLSAVPLSARSHVEISTDVVGSVVPRGTLHTVPVLADPDPGRRELPAHATEPFRLVGIT
ncbi:hypothetical protein ABZT08_29885 [Streptomyces sp. NPDC005526]|uniref:hypothetical protein n=1 Tax=Streptomyces sp. NPDC005526 TaxID=3156885 RepID=UPI0033BF0B05